MRHNKLIFKFIYLLLVLFLISSPSAVIAGDATSFDPTAVSVKAKKISGVPIGGVIPWTAGTVPEDYLECNGQSTTGYPDLAIIVGARVPDLRGTFVRGWDHSRAIKSVQASSIPTMAAQVYAQEGPGDGHYDANVKVGAIPMPSWTASSGVIGHTNLYPYSGVAGGFRASAGARVVQTGGGENRPRNTALMYIIKAQ